MKNVGTWTVDGHGQRCQIIDYTRPIMHVAYQAVNFLPALDESKDALCQALKNVPYGHLLIDKTWNWILPGISSGLIPLIADLYADDIQLFYSHNGACLPMFIHEPYLKRWWISLIIFVITPVSAIVLISLCYLGIFLHVEQSRQDSERSRADKSHLKKVLAITVSNNFSWITIIVIKVLALFGVDIPSKYVGPRINCSFKIGIL